MSFLGALSAALQIGVIALVIEGMISFREPKKKDVEEE